MLPNTPTCVPLFSCAGSEPATRLRRPGTINLRSSALCPPQCIDTSLHVWREPYVWATSTGATVDVDAPSRGATLGVFICGSFFAEAPSNDRCARLPPEHLPKFDVFVNLYDGAHVSLLRLPRSKIHRASMVVA